MLPAPLYSPIYLTIVTILTIALSIRYKKLSDYDILHGVNKTLIFQTAIPIIIALFIGFRPLSGYYFGDMSNYNIYYTSLYGKEFIFSWDKKNFLFDNFIEWLSANQYEVTTFFVYCSFIYFLGTYIGLRTIFNNNSLYAFICFLGAFSTFSYGTNGLKAGMAAAIFYIALSYYNKPLIFALFLWISLGFHHSMILPIIAVVITYFYRNSRIYLLFWFVTLIIAFLHITYFQTLLGEISEEGNNSYLNNIDTDWGGKGGFRLDFILYSCVPIITGYYWYVRRNLKDKLYSIIYNTYILTNGVWMLCMYASYTNRIAYLSWFLFPLVLIYPLLKFDLFERQGKIVNYTVWGQLLFTLAMAYLYY
ncbi:MAG: hypothetical protein HDS67_10085 [Bacteroidales bacterium]|nr:hypothetical protein [Bacteroidales bacterium]